MSPSPDHIDALIPPEPRPDCAAAKARSEIKETELKSAHIRAAGKAAPRGAAIQSIIGLIADGIAILTGLTALTE